MIQEFRKSVGEWGESTFPDATAVSIAAHIKEEADELHDAVTSPECTLARAWEEAADIYLMLIHFAHRYGFDLDDVAKAKFDQIQTDEWESDPGAKGYRKRIKK